MSKRKAKVVAEPEVQQEVTELSLVIESSPEQEEVLEKEAKEIVASKGTKEMFEEWFSEEGNKKMIAEVSNSLREKFKNKNGGWFTLRDMTIFTSYKKIEDALGLLNLIKLGGLLVAEMKGGKEISEIGVMFVKLCITAPCEEIISKLTDFDWCSIWIACPAATGLGKMRID